MNVGKRDLVVFGTIFSAITLPIVLTIWRRRRRVRTRPKAPNNDAKWKLIGNLATIIMYPLKSGRGMDLDESDCTDKGLCQVRKDNKVQLRDRYFMIFREDNGELITAHTFPNMLLITVDSENENSVRISHPEKSDLIVNIPHQKQKLTRMWRNEPVNCLDCGDEAASWVTDIISQHKEKRTSVRLGYWPSDKQKRNIVATYTEWFNDQVFNGVTDMDSGAFSDIASYMLMTSSSLDELNRRLEDLEVSPKQFRPNFVVQTDQPPFSDLHWKWVKIGTSIFRFVKGCERCLLTTYDPETAIKCSGNEPIKTLKSIEEANCKVPIEEGPMMGIYVGLYETGRVHVGDPVFILN